MSISNKFYEATPTSLNSIYELVCDTATAYRMRHGNKLNGAW